MSQPSNTCVSRCFSSSRRSTFRKIDLFSLVGHWQIDAGVLRNPLRPDESSTDPKEPLSPLLFPPKQPTFNPDSSHMYRDIVLVNRYAALETTYGDKSAYKPGDVVAMKCAPFSFFFPQPRRFPSLFLTVSPLTCSPPCDSQITSRPLLPRNKASHRPPRLARPHSSALQRQRADGADSAGALLD